MFIDTSVSDFDPVLPTAPARRPRSAETVAEPEPLVVICFVCRSERRGGHWTAGRPAPADGHPGDPGVTHGLCQRCLDRLYPEAGAAEVAAP